MRSLLPILGAALWCAGALYGCASPGGPSDSRAPASPSLASSGETDQAMSSADTGPASKDAAESTRLASQGGTVRGIERRIIYNATVALIVENLSAVELELTRLVRSHGAFVSQNDVSGAPGQPRSGNWTIRVPVSRFDAFIAAVKTLGENQSVHLDSQDVTEEYVDIEARLANKRVEERRLIRHLEASTARLTDILAVEREISRVRSEIEQMEGRRRYLQDQTSLTTITVTLTEVQGYVPEERATFTAQMGRTFGQSFTALREFAQAIILAVVAMAPWLLVLALLGVPAWWMLRRRSAAPEPPAGSA